MGLIALVVVGVAVLIVLLVRTKRARERRELVRYTIRPDELHGLLASKADVIVLDVRQPLDLLAYPETIPGARRVEPKEVARWADTVSRDRDTVIYCTCPSDETSRWVLRKALDLHFTRIKFLKGGLAGWKAGGFPVEPYDEVFHLDSAG